MKATYHKKTKVFLGNVSEPKETELIAVLDFPLEGDFYRAVYDEKTKTFSEGATEEEIFNSREIPNEVPLWCVKAILHEMDLLQTVEGALSQLDEPVKSRANYIWNYGNIIKRDSQTVDFIGQVLQKSKIEIDEIFINADKIEL